MTTAATYEIIDKSIRNNTMNIKEGCMLILIFMVVSGPVGDYLGYQNNAFIANTGYDSLFTIVATDGDSTIADTISVIDTLHLGPYPAYRTRHIRLSDVASRHDTTLSWEIGDTLFTPFTGDSSFMRLYVTPFTTGQQWDLGITGDTLIADIDFDGIDDTLIVQSSEGMVIDSTTVTVPVGTFETFEILLTVNLAGWQSYIDDSCHVWTHAHQWISPYFGPVRDSTILIDTVFQYIWFEAMRLITFSEAVDSGYTHVAEQSDEMVLNTKKSYAAINTITLKSNGVHHIELYDVTGTLVDECQLYVEGNQVYKPPVSAGVYFAYIENNGTHLIVKCVVVR
jgi:hypothetical protein